MSSTPRIQTTTTMTSPAIGHIGAISPAESNSGTTCSFCARTSAAKICGGCIDAPGADGKPIPRTVYCNSDCQKAHWPAHKATCKDHQARKILHRAGDTVQKDSQTICSFCAKISAAKICSGCIGAPGADGKPIANVAYCNSDCQKAHWPAHKSTCKGHQARKILHRAGDTVQKAFYVYREKSFDSLFTKVTHVGRDLFLQEGYWNTRDILVPFPVELLPAREDREAVLVERACCEGVGYMHDLTKILLKGICSNIVEVCVRPRNLSRRVRVIRPTGHLEVNDDLHDLIRVTLKTGESFAFDISGAQFGHYDSVLPWKRYLDERLGKVVAMAEFGTWKGNLTSEEVCSAARREGPIRVANLNYQNGFNRSISKWQKENSTLEEMLKSQETSFQALQASFLKGVENELQSVLDWEKQALSEGKGKVRKFNMKGAKGLHGSLETAEVAKKGMQQDEKKKEKQDREEKQEKKKTNRDTKGLEASPGSRFLSGALWFETEKELVFHLSKGPRYHQFD